MSVPAVSSISLQSNSQKPLPLDRKELFEKVYLQSKDSLSPYALSIPLLAADDQKDYEDLLTKMFAALSIEATDSAEQIANKLQANGSFNAWILGRVLVSSLDHQDGATALKMAEAMDLLLQKAPCDEFSTWAMGYFAIYHAGDANYRAKCQTLTETLMQKEGEEQKDNVIWALVMNLQSASIASDEASYRKILSQMTTYYGTVSVAEALETKIPAADFTAWAISLVQLAATRMQDQALCQSLKDPLERALAASPSQGDQLLALVNLEKAFRES